MTARFPLGRITATPGAVETFTWDDISACLRRHQAGESDCGAADTRENELAIKMGGLRVFSVYQFGNRKLWIITEADRASTCCLLPSDY